MLNLDVERLPARTGQGGGGIIQGKRKKRFYHLQRQSMHWWLNGHLRQMLKLCNKTLQSINTIMACTDSN